MIIFKLKGPQLQISLNIKNYGSFNAAVRILKDQKFRYNSSSRSWVGPWFKKDQIKDALEDIDTIEDHITQEQISQLAEGKPEQFTEPVRRITDYSLLNYGPITGKTPHEDFQKLAINKGINKSSYCFFYGQGSGKSYIASAIIAHRVYKYKDCSKVLFITTNIGVRNLYHELFKFIKDLDPNKVVIADKDFRNPFDDDKYDIIITSYNSIRLICDYYKKQYKITSKTPRKPFLPLEKWFNSSKGMLILDESHCVANPSSQQTHLIALHSELFTYRYLFSGTPADKPEKLWQQYNIVDPYLVYNLSFNEWKDKMAYLGDRFSAYAIRDWKKDELEKQNQRFLQSYGEYYSTTDLVDLPDYNEKVIYIPMHPSHRAIYEEFVIQDLAGKKTVRDIVNRFPYMSLSVDDPSLLEKHFDKFDDKFQKMVSSFKDSYLEKYNALADIIADNPDEKIIVWVIHPSTANRICEKFKNLNPICITGATEQNERFDLVDEFKKGDHKLLVANITTLNTSVTILESHISVYMERNFNYTEYDQSRKRNYRIGQENEVKSFILTYDKSIDVLLHKNLQSKGVLVKGLCSKDFLTQEEWQRIFSAEEKDNF